MNENGKGKRIAALIGVALIVIMVIATLITAFTDQTGKYFRSCLIVTIALPIALWVFIWSYGALMHRHTIASYDIDSESDSSRMTENSSSESVPADRADQPANKTDVV